jgi:putative ABC transport system permease protein
MIGESLIELGPYHLASTAVLVLGMLGISLWQRVGMERDIVVGSIRTVVQLLLVGYLIQFVFSVSQWWLVLAMLLAMLVVATHAARGRLSGRQRGTALVLAAGMAVSLTLTLLIVTQIVVRVGRWYDPQYLIPLGGMILGTAMNAAALAAERLASEVTRARSRIEVLLSLGASPKQAIQRERRSAFRAAMIPSINALMTVGIVQLPGMMTGQILAGGEALVEQAVRYQIVVMIMLAFAVAVTTLIVVLALSHRFFTPAEQLRPGSRSGTRAAA